MSKFSVRLRTGKKKKVHNAEPTAELVTSQAEKADFVGENILSLKQIANGSPPPPNTILHLQRTIGNQAVQRLLNTTGTTIQRCNGDENCSCPKCAAKHQAKQADEMVQRTAIIQRCNGDENCTCPKCAAKHQTEETVQRSAIIQRCNGDENCSCPKCAAKHQAKQSDEMVQRVISDGHDLTAAPIAGDARLEDAYDGDRSQYLRRGAKGESVKKVQSALLQLGHQLPKFGPDGDYGGETRSAVKKFQSSKTIDDDGVVGKDTLDELNKALGGGPSPAPLPGTMPAHTASDFKIDHVDKSTKDKLFFERNKATLTAEANAEIAKLKAAAPGPVRLIGFASGEEDPALAEARAKAVEAAMIVAPNPITVTSATGNATATATSANFSTARSVEIVIGSATPKTLDCDAKFDTGPNKGKLKNPPTQPCPTMDIDTWNAFNKVWPVAKEAMEKAVPAADPTDATYNGALVKKFFGNDSPATIAALKLNLTNLKQHVNDLPAKTNCGGECDKGGCENGPIAYNNGVDGASSMTLCVPTFKNLNDNDAARNLIHESAHGTSPLGGGRTEGTRDVAYRHERMMFQLEPKDRLRNSDSYALFAMYVRETQIKKDPNAVPSGIKTPSNDTLVGFSDSKEQDALKVALAHFEKRMTWCSDHVGQMYGELLKVKNGKITWKQSWAESMMRQAADRFPVTRPPTKPTVDDQAIVAAIIDRYKHMYKAVKRDLKITRIAAGIVKWAKDGDLAADNFEVGPDFFAATFDNQISLLVEAVANATADVESAFVPSYVSFARWVHENANE